MKKNKSNLICTIAELTFAMVALAGFVLAFAVRASWLAAICGIVFLCNVGLFVWMGMSLGVKASRLIGNSIIYIILVAITIIWLFPFFGIVLESFKVETRMQTGYLWPKQFGFDNYIRLFKETNFLTWFKNTAIMGVATAILQTVFILSMS